jgi:hypothetical protein
MWLTRPCSSTAACTARPWPCHHAHDACLPWYCCLDPLEVQPVLLEVAGYILTRKAINTHDLKDLLGNSLCNKAWDVVPLVRHRQEEAFELQQCKQESQLHSGCPENVR